MLNEVDVTVSIDIGRVNLSWIVVSNDMILSWQKVNIYEAKTKRSELMPSLFIKAITTKLVEPYLLNKNVEFVVETQIYFSKINKSLEQLLKTHLETGFHGQFRCLKYVNMHSKQKFSITKLFFDDLCLKHNKGNKMAIPNTRASNMKTASIDRIKLIFLILHNGIEVAHVPKNLLQYESCLLQVQKQDDMCDTLLQYIAFVYRKTQIAFKSDKKQSQSSKKKYFDDGKLEIVIQ